MKKDITKWFYYNHAVLPQEVEPHEEVNEPIIDSKFWKEYPKGAFLARWTSEWDSELYKDWWYVIKDSVFDIEGLKSKRRYEIKKGKKNFEVRKIDAKEYIDTLYTVQEKAYSAWPEKYRPQTSMEDFSKSIINSDYTVFAAFDIQSEEIEGYAIIVEHKEHADFSTLRVNPKCEKKGINFAMVAGILENYSDRLEKEYYICDGARAIRHETSFQDFLEKYFGFRKVYCKLNIKYKPFFQIIVYVLYPFRFLFKKNRTNIGSSINAILKMEEIRRRQ